METTVRPPSPYDLEGKMHKFYFNDPDTTVLTSPSGRYQIIKKVATKEDVRLVRMRSLMGGNTEYAGFKAGTYTVLKDTKRGDIVMSDTNMEISTNSQFMRNANGRVLIGGFGLGVTLMYLQEHNTKVEEIIVVEKSKEIIDWVVPMLPIDKDLVRVIHGDIFEYTPEGKYDTIWFDIWNATSPDNHPEMKKLHRKFARRLNRDNPNAFMTSWRKEEVYKMAAAERNYGYYY